MDDKMTIQELKEKIKIFCEARNWDQFHGLKDLSIGVATEASELLEIFRFKSDTEIDELLRSPDRRKVHDELADVFFFILRIAQKYQIDLTEAFATKMEANARRYPVEKAYNSNKKFR